MDSRNETIGCCDVVECSPGTGCEMTNNLPDRPRRLTGDLVLIGDFR